MKFNTGILIALGVAMSLAAADAQTATPPPVIPQPVDTFKIFYSPLNGQDVFLLNTQDGRVWQLTKFTDVQGQPEVWEAMNILSTQSDYTTFFQNNPPIKQPGQ